MSHIYIAYHRDDSDFAARVMRQIEDAGFRVWMDHERVRAEHIRWRESIDQAIRDAFALLVIISPAARASEQVNYEWTFALGTDIPVIPVIYKQAPLHPRQRILTRVDFTETGAPPWGKLLRIIHEAHDEDNDPRGRRYASRSGTVPPWERDRLSPIERARRSRAAQRDSKPFPPMIDSKMEQPHKLLEALESDDRDQRAHAAHRLGELNDRSTIPALIKLLRNDDWRVREAAASTLAKLKAAAALPALLETLRQSRPGPFGSSGPNRVVVDAIREIGPAGIRVLIDALSDDDARLRLVIVDLLGEFGDTDAIPALASALRDPEPGVRSQAADALGKLGSESAVPDLLALLSDSDKDVRISAAWALGQIGHPSALDALLKLLHDREWRTRWAAAQALWEIGAPAVPGLIAKLYEPDEYVRHAAVQALAEIREPAIEPLIRTLGARDWDARWGAAAALQAIGAPAVPVLVETLHSRDWQAGWAAAETLKRINTTEALEAVATWQQDHPPGAEASQPDTGSSDTPHASPATHAHRDSQHDDIPPSREG